MTADERWWALGQALVAEGFLPPQFVTPELRASLERVLRRTATDHPGSAHFESTRGHNEEPAPSQEPVQ